MLIPDSISAMTVAVLILLTFPLTPFVKQTILKATVHSALRLLGGVFYIGHL